MTFFRRLKWYLWGKKALNIRASDLVLEVGSGGNPHWRSDVLCDKFVDDGRERPGHDPVVSDRPFVASDACRLPFRDGAFDYVIACHILEHVESPEAMIAELSRVAKGGYIECPSEYAEKLFGWPFHKWFVRQENGRLVLTAKDKPIYDQGLTAIGQWSPTNRFLTSFSFAHPELFFVMHEWQSRIDFEVRGRPEVWAKEFETASVEESTAALPRGTVEKCARGFLQWAKSFRRRSSRSKPVPTLGSILCCVKCRGAVEVDSQAVICKGCHATFPVLRGIPRML